MAILRLINTILASFKPLEFTAPLLFRLLLAWVFFWAGMGKIGNIDGTIAWFTSMGYPAPALAFWLATLTELVGAFMLLAGFGIRWIAPPLMFTMGVAIISVHWDHGWYAIAQSRFDTPPAALASLFAEQGVQCRVARVNEMIAACGRPDFVTDGGRYSVALLQNGIEFAAMYFMMLLSLFFTGGGALVSADYWIKKTMGDDS